MMIPFQLDSIHGRMVSLKNSLLKTWMKKKELKVDYFLPFFGLSTNLGPIKDWELELEKNILKVNRKLAKQT